jgi:hypothetical protein
MPHLAASLEQQPEEQQRVQSEPGQKDWQMKQRWERAEADAMLVWQ